MSHTTPVQWRKSSYSGANNDCVEVADVGTSVWVRDSKHPEAGYLSLSHSELAALIDAAKAGELDDIV